MDNPRPSTSALSDTAIADELGLDEELSGFSSDSDEEVILPTLENLSDEDSDDSDEGNLGQGPSQSNRPSTDWCAYNGPDFVQYSYTNASGGYKPPSTNKPLNKSSKQIEHRKFRELLVTELVGNVRSSATRKRKSTTDNPERLDGKQHFLRSFENKKKDCKKNLLKTLVRAENEGHQEYLKLLLNEVNNKQTRLKRLRETRRRTKQQPVNVIKKKVRTRLKRLRETRRRTKQQPVNVIKKKVRQQPVNVIKKKKVRKNLLKTLENEGHQKYLKLLLNEVNNKQTRLKRLRETRRRTKQQPVNVIKKKKNLLKTLVRAENEGHQEYLKLLLNEVINKQTRLKRLRETRRRTKQQPVNVIKKKSTKYLKLLLNEVNNKQTRLKRLRETRRMTKQQPVNVIKKKVRQQPVNVIKKKKVRKNVLKTLVRAENEGHQEYLKLLLNEINNKQTRLKRQRGMRRRTKQQPVNVIKKKVRKNVLKTLENEGHQEYLKLLLNEVNNKQTRLKRLRETRRRTKQQPVNVIKKKVRQQPVNVIKKKKVRKNVLKTLVRTEKEGHQEYLKLLLNEVNNKQTRLKRLRETRRTKQQPVNVIKKKKVRVNNKQTRLKRLRERRTKQQPVNVIKKKVRQQPVNVIKKKKVRKNLLKTLVRAENEGHQEYLKLLLYEVNNKQTRLKRLRETRRRTKQQPVNVIKKKVRQQPVNVIKKKKVRKNVLKTLDRAENEGHQEYLKLLLYEVNNKQTRLKRLRETRRRTKQQPVNVIKKKVRQQPVNVIKKKKVRTRLIMLRETRRRTKQQPVNVIKKKVRKNLLKTLVRAENEGHQEYLKLLLNEVNNKQTRLKRLRETRRRTKQQPVNVIKKKVRKNLLKTLVRAENEGHQEYLKLLLNEIINKQTRLKRLRETRRRTKQQPVNVIKKKVRKNVLKTLDRAENEGHQEYLKLLLYEVNNKQTRLKRLRETRRRTKQQPVNVIKEKVRQQPVNVLKKKKVRKNLLKTLVRAENEGHQEYLKLLLNEVNNKQTRLKRLRETRRRTKQQPVNVIKKKVRKNVLKTLDRAENEGHQEYLKLLLYEVNNKQTRLKRLRETRRRTKQQPVNVIKEKVRQQPVNVLKKKKVRKNLLKTLVRAENEGHQEYLKLLLNEVNNKQTRLKRLRETRRRTKQQPVNVIKKKVRVNNKQTRLKRLRETRRTKQQPVNVIKKKVRQQPVNVIKKKKVRKNLLKTLVRAENEGHQEYLKLLLNEIINKQTRLKRLRETRRRTKQQPVNVIKKKVRKNVLKTLDRAENEGHQEYLKLLLYEVNNKQTRLKRLRETRRRTKQQPVNVIKKKVRQQPVNVIKKKKVRKNLLKTLVRAENEGHQEYLKLLLNEVNNKQTRLKRLRETRRRTKQQPVNVIKKKVRQQPVNVIKKKKVRKNVLKTLDRAENEGHQEYLKLLLYEVNNKQTRLKRLRETRRRTKQQPVNVIKEKVRQQPVNVLKKKKVRKNLLKTLVRAENEGHQEYLKLLLNEII
ncbi:hypothetical protein J6590_098902 [Homalodisca vitripennis]|nr:hypothetical protein J6590_098902 [Homalodisca vitripennis]